jgi:hypothetical protein
MLEIPVSLSICHGLAFCYFADLRDYERFDPSRTELAPYLAGAVQSLEENGTEHRELSVIRAWLELLIASSNKDVQAFGIDGVQGLSDVVLPHPGVDAMPIEEWHHVLEWVRQKLFHLDGPMTAEDKARIKREVKITGSYETVDEFRARRAAAGLLDPE